ncbi:hypothetical protein ACROYT_G014438 [Oculina patagonica]
MAKDKVDFCWDTKCALNGTQQPVLRKTIDPLPPASLAAGDKVRVKFSGRWCNAFVVTPWMEANTKASQAVATREAGDIPSIPESILQKEEGECTLPEAPSRKGPEEIGMAFDLSGQ